MKNEQFELTTPDNQKDMITRKDYDTDEIIMDDKLNKAQEHYLEKAQEGKGFKITIQNLDNPNSWSKEVIKLEPKAVDMYFNGTLDTQVLGELILDKMTVSLFSLAGNYLVEKDFHLDVKTVDDQVVYRRTNLSDSIISDIEKVILTKDANGRLLSVKYMRHTSYPGMNSSGSDEKFYTSHDSLGVFEFLKRTV